MNRTLRVLTSRWTELALLQLALAGGIFRLPWLLYAALGGTVAMACALIWSRPVREAFRTGRRYPRTPEARAYAERRRLELEEELKKNKIEIRNNNGKSC